MTALVPIQHDPFELAERICRSQLVPQAYRGKPVDAAICMLYGAEVGLPPMTALNRIIVINGKPTLDSQGMAALIRGRGHSIVGETSNESATVKGKRLDNGDEMSVTFTIDDAKRAGLVKNGPWTQYPSSMLWARAVSKLARELFPDVLMGMSYVPEEIGGDEYGDDFSQPANPIPVGGEGEPHTAVYLPAQGSPPVADLIDVDTGEIVTADVVDAEVMENRADPTPEHLPRSEPPAQPTPIASSPQELKIQLQQLLNDQPDGEKSRLRARLLTLFGPQPNRTLEQLQESVDMAAGWPNGANPTDPTF